jgi:hypothetical protein
MTEQETFVTRLRRHRERARVSLHEIAEASCVKEDLLEGLERNDLSAWPRGLYARAYVRAYAHAVGLDPMETVDEFCRLFPHGDRRARATMEEMAAIVASPAEWRDEFHGISEMDRRKSPKINMLAKPTRRETAFAVAARAGRALVDLVSSWSSKNSRYGEHKA